MRTFGGDEPFWEGQKMKTPEVVHASCSIIDGFVLASHGMGKGLVRGSLFSHALPLIHAVIS